MLQITVGAEVLSLRKTRNHVCFSLRWVWLLLSVDNRETFLLRGGDIGGEGQVRKAANQCFGLGSEVILTSSLA